MKQITARLFSVKEDGLYDKEDKSIGDVAFIFDGCIVSGWYLDEVCPTNGRLWEANSDVGRGNTFAGIEQYIIFDSPIWNLGNDLEDHPQEQDIPGVCSSCGRLREET
jgi:hypothetical protein